MRTKIMLLIGSTRIGRMTPRAAGLVYQELKKREDAEIETVDLADYNIPMLVNRLKYWKNPEPDVVKLSEIISGSDILIIVTPEYNGSFPGVLKNALDYFVEEYMNKIAGIVTVSAGPRGGDFCYSTLKEFFRRLDVHKTVHLKINKIQETITEDGIDKGNYKEKIDLFLSELFSAVEHVKENTRF